MNCELRARLQPTISAAAHKFIKCRIACLMWVPPTHTHTRTHTTKRALQMWACEGAVPTYHVGYPGLLQTCFSYQNICWKYCHVYFNPEFWSHKFRVSHMCFTFSHQTANVMVVCASSCKEVIKSVSISKQSEIYCRLISH